MRRVLLHRRELVGVDKINKWATLLGLGVKSGIDLPNELQGLVPSTKWKLEKMHEKCTPAKRFRSVSGKARCR